MAPPLDYYRLLDLDDKRHTLTLTHQEVRAAYRRALLHHHPDKSAKIASKSPSVSSSASITVDDIALAYKVLSDPQLRAEYDRQLRYAGATAELASSGDKPLRTGLETVDLDDLTFDSDRCVWSRSCRCGDATGFVLSESDLEENAEDGEVMVGCKGCSLWLRVLFGVES